MALRTLKDGSRSLAGFLSIEPAIGRVPYYFWQGGIVPAESGAWASNAPLPHISRLLNGRIFCAGVPNWFLRANDKRVPIAQFQSELYDGGMAAYFGSPMLPQIGAGYFAGYSEGWDTERALRVAYDTRKIVMGFWRYTGVPLELQGHVFLVFPSGWVLQSTPANGLHWSRLPGSYADNHATGLVVPENWLDYAGDEVR